jgi:hypothetical protein
VGERDVCEPDTGVSLRDQFTLERLIERFGLDRSEGEDF